MAVLKSLADSIYNKGTVAKQGGPVKRPAAAARNRQSRYSSRMQQSAQSLAAAQQFMAQQAKQQREMQRRQQTTLGRLASRLTQGQPGGLLSSDRGANLISPFGGDVTPYASAGAFQKAPQAQLGGSLGAAIAQNVQNAQGTADQQAVLRANAFGYNVQPGENVLGTANLGAETGASPWSLPGAPASNEAGYAPPNGPAPGENPNPPGPYDPSADNEMLRQLKEWYRQQRIAQWAQSKVSDYYQPLAQGPGYFDYGGGNYWGGGGGGGFQNNEQFWLDLARWDVLR